MRNQNKQTSSPAIQVVLAIAVCVTLAPAAAGAQSPCQPRTDAPGRECFVSPAGRDDNPGTITQPFKTISQGVSVLQAGDILNLRHGIYVEAVDIAGKQGTPTANIVIRSYPGEQAYIDGSVPDFRKANQPDPAWKLASRFDPENAHPEEYVSVATFPEGVTNADKVVDRGAFLDRNPYTRLITYSKLEDLRAWNETFEQIPMTDTTDPRPGPAVTDEQGTSLGYRYPWVYMGPGIWFNRDPTSPTAGKVHIRLSHTSNNINGMVDYTGEVDPNKIKLAITPKDMTTLQVRGSRYLRFENLSIRYGGEHTILLTSVQGVIFDHVRIWATTYGVRMGGDAATDPTKRTTNTIFRHCEFNGGLPTWHFRSDHKREYYYYDNDLGMIAHNMLGKQTVRTLLLGSPNNTDTELHHCEFFKAHDLYLIDQNLRFHHNWVYNLNDEGLFVDAVDKTSTTFLEMKIYQNVIEKTLSSISFAGAHEEGRWYIYRNLIDLRSPTAGYRPRRPGDKKVWRYGHFPKSNLTDGPYDVFQNTFLVYAQVEHASYLHYKNLNGSHRRRSFNNIFVAVNPDAASDKPITLLPSPAFPAETDGNAYHRIGQATTPRYRYLEYQYDEPPPCSQRCSFDTNMSNCCPGDMFACLTGCVDALDESLLFEQSQRQYAPGYEADSIEADPQFRQIRVDGLFQVTDDLRLRSASPARAAGVRLPDDLHALDPFAPASGKPDIGCYPHGSGPLWVGVDGRRSYPPAL